jgi:carboxyl-terminal processing protease
MRYILSVLSVAVVAVTLGKPVAAKAETNFGQVAMHVAYMLQNHHYSRKDFDDSVSEQLLSNYLDLLDFRHVFFTQEDVDGFKAKYATTLDDHVLMRNVAPAQEIYDVYVERVKNRVEFAKKVLETTEFKFDSDASIELKRDKAPWPKTTAESDELWMRLLEENMLSETLIAENRERDRVKKEKEKAEKAAEKAAEKPAGEAGAEAPAKNAEAEVKEKSAEDKAKDAAKVASKAKEEDEDEKLTPKERVLKDYQRLLDNLKENENEDVINYFLSSLSATYDPHTEYMSQTEIDTFNINMRHSLVGIGALLESKEDVAEIRGIVVGGPADKQGELQLGDQIISVAQGDADFVDVKFMKLQKIVDMIRGDVDSTVRLKVVPASDRDSTKIIAIKRAEVELKEKLANAEMIITPDALGKPIKVGWIMMPSFYADMEEGKVSMTEDVAKLLKRLMKEKIDGLVLDLRGNGGGSLEEAIKLTGLFVPAGPVVQAKDWRGNITWRESENPDPLYDGPMVVMTDKSSASASEILAAALQDYRRAVIVGDDSTFGKGTVQTILPVERFMPFFSDKSRAGALKVTIQKFYRIAGGSTQLKGVEPDLKLPSVRNVLDIGEASTANPLEYDTIPARDYQFVRKDPLPIEALAASLQSRLAENTEFKYVQDEAMRIKERVDKNVVTLNIEQRRRERDEAEKRRDAQEALRKERAKEVAAKLGDNGFKTYQLTLDNVDAPQLPLITDVSSEQRSGMRVAAEDKDESSGGVEDFPYGIEPPKLEAVNILRDLIQALGKQPTTAETTPKPVK